MKKKKFAAWLAFATMICSCGQDSFTNQVDKDFKEKKEILSEGNLFRVFDQELTPEENRALTFLYAYMPVGDITDYSAEFYLENVRSSLSVRRETPWGEIVPEDIFAHFVLPIRVNNEQLDSSRMVFHDEIMPRLKGLSMQEAVLEVNHWCHEKVSYHPSDIRTSSPLASVKTAYGRCGEESTFLVAALRAVGIPARQVYTPRWAHTDDNHAWVEAWVDGKWYFLGACEPEPVLNLGWFNAPASRGMLMHTKVFGRYNGPEEVMRTTANYTEINIIDNYAESAPCEVIVVDEAGAPVSGASVEFKIYNYAEFFTVHKVTTGADGRAALSAGLGDMMVLVSKGDRFGMQKISFGKDSSVKIALDKTVGDAFSFQADMVPPTGEPELPEVTPEQRAENTVRFNREDSIRNAYIATFPDEKAIGKFARKEGYAPSDVTKYLLASRGNYQDIMNFLSHAAQKDYRKRAVELLSTLSEKDLRDTPEAILNDHLYATDIQADVNTVLAPRIADEMLSPYRTYFQKEVPAADATRFVQDPQQLVEWCVKNIRLRNDLCRISTFISPQGVWRARVSDTRSRDVFFVAVARSLGVPSWVDRVTGDVFYEKDGKEVKVDFEKGEILTRSQGTLKLDYQPIEQLNDPEYARHFSLSRFDDNTFSLLNYPEFEKWSNLFESPSAVDTGYYMMVSGSRLASGSVLCNVSFFNVESDKQTDENLVMRSNKEAVRVIGSLDAESPFINPETGEQTTILKTTGRGFYVLGVLGVGQEPTIHTLKGMEEKAKEFEACGLKIVLLCPDKGSYDKFKTSNLAAALPKNVVLGIDEGGVISGRILNALELKKNTPLPLFVIADTFNRIVFASNGYTIGLEVDMLKIISGLEK